MDLYSRRIVGWSMHDSMTSQLVADALMMAVWRRGKPAALLHHSDQGSQYTSEHFQELLKEQGITCSMSRAGEVWDNSAMESFFSSLKTERIARKVYRSREQARAKHRGLRSANEPEPGNDAQILSTWPVRSPGLFPGIQLAVNASAWQNLDA
jgi:transposase InsO family protein